MASSSRTYSKPLVRTLDPDNAHDRLLKRNSNHRKSIKPKSVTDLDVLKAKNQFIRDSNVNASDMSWEDALALKYYETLFREYAVINLKHYKTGAVALRWRTESEVLAEIGNRTCGSLRCKHHQPTISTNSEDEFEEDEEDQSPLVEARLIEYQIPFGYLEGGIKKSALVKVCLCKKCEVKLLKSREAGKKSRGEEGSSSRYVEETSRRVEVDSEEDDEERAQVDEPEEDEWTPSLPPEMKVSSTPDRIDRRERENISRSSRRRSASPDVGSW